MAIGLLGLASLVAWLALSPLAGAAEQRAGATRYTVGIATTPLGKIVVDSRGRSLYLFEADHKRTSACYGACAKAWPPVIAVGKPKAGPGARAALLGVLMRKDGKQQVTYRGHPLYRFFKDTKGGQVKGQGLDFFGGEWYVLTPAASSSSTRRRQTTTARAARPPAAPHHRRRLRLSLAEPICPTSGRGPPDVGQVRVALGWLTTNIDKVVSGAREQPTRYRRVVDGLVLPVAIATHTALDFCNTLAGWNEPGSHDYLATYAHLAVWARESGLVDARSTSRALERPTTTHGAHPCSSNGHARSGARCMTHAPTAQATRHGRRSRGRRAPRRHRRC